jgi:hypothetical protein
MPDRNDLVNISRNKLALYRQELDDLSSLNLEHIRDVFYSWVSGVAAKVADPAANVFLNHLAPDNAPQGAIIAKLYNIARETVGAVQNTDGNSDTEKMVRILAAGVDTEGTAASQGLLGAMVREFGMISDAHDLVDGVRQASINHQAVTTDYGRINGFVQTRKKELEELIRTEEQKLEALTPGMNTSVVSPGVSDVFSRMDELLIQIQAGVGQVKANLH